MSNQQTPGDLIIDSLEDLKGYEFKKFKNKLSDFSQGDIRPIPRGKLENVDCLGTKDLLLDTYGEEGALDVTIEVLEQINLNGHAKNLQKRREENDKLKISTNSSRLKEWRKEYMESMKGLFQRIKEYNTPRGEAVSLEKRYTQLKLIKGPQVVDKDTNGMVEQIPPQDMKIKSDEHFPFTIPTLFDSDEEDFIPKIVVLQGPAGIGKTMTSRKIMLDWAAGNLYQGKFDFAFHLSCRELNNITENINLVLLLSETCNLQSSDELMFILKDPKNHKRILFIVDGFDELRWTLEKTPKVCHDIFEKTHIEILLQRLLMKQVLNQSSLIITTRPLALEKLHSFVEDARHVEILGFTEKDRLEYFHNFFRNESDAEKALSIIIDHDILNSLCSIPIVCWIVCTVMKHRIKQPLDLMQVKTITSIYLLYLEDLIKHHVKRKLVQTCLKKLCALANEGILNQKIVFEMKDLDSHGLSLSEVESLFLKEYIFYQDTDVETCYSFIHLSVQEFLAALYYVLDDGSGKKEGTNEFREDNSIPEICKGNSLLDMCILHPHLTLTVRFLCGLLNVKVLRKFSKNTGIGISSSTPDRHSMEQWLTGPWQWQEFSTGNPVIIHCSEAISCLYETQDTDILKKILPSSSCLELVGARKGPFLSGENCSKQLCFCLKTCKGFKSLSFTYLVLDPEYLKMLSSLLHGCQKLSFQYVKVRSGDSPGGMKAFHFTQYDESPDKEELLLFPSANEVPADLSWLDHPQSSVKELKFYHCGLTASACNDICTFMRKNKRLTTLDLSGNRLRDKGLKILCEGLKDPACNLKHLRIHQCYLTPSCCEDLYSLLVTNQTLASLDLSSNGFGDSGIKRLCEGLKDPRCALKNLNIDGLTSLNCDDLRSVLIKNRSLIKLIFSMNNVEDSGIKCIFVGLKHPDCTLKELSASFRQATVACFDDICSAISSNRSLTTLEICFKTDMEILESDPCFKSLRSLGCIVQKTRPYVNLKIGPDGVTQKELKSLDILYRRPSLPR